MAALPADVAKFTREGVVVSARATAIRDAHPDAIDESDSVIEMFYDSSANAQTVLDQMFEILSQVEPFHEAVEVNDSLKLGTVTPITPTVPCFRVVDAERGIDTVVRTRALAYDMGIDRYSVELIK